MLNLSIFKSRRFSFACLSSLLNFMAIYTVVFLTPWYLADALHRNVLTVGMVMMAFALLTFFVGPLSGSLSDRIGSRGLAFGGADRKTLYIGARGSLFTLQTAAAGQ